MVRMPPQELGLHPSMKIKNREGSIQIQWKVDGRKMLRNNGMLVSPPFALAFEGLTKRPTFRIVLHGNGRITRKGQRAGKLQLKCDEDLPENMSKVGLRVDIKS